MDGIILGADRPLNFLGCLMKEPYICIRSFASSSDSSSFPPFYNSVSQVIIQEGSHTATANPPTTTSTPTTKRCRYTSTLLRLTYPRAKKEFWTARLREFPAFVYNPWDFYEPFLKRGSRLSLVLCNDETEVRTIRIFGHARVTNRRPGGLRLVLRATGGIAVCQVIRLQTKKEECNMY